MPDTFQNDLNDPNDQKCWTFLLKNSKVAHIEPLLQEVAGFQCRKGTAGRLGEGGCPWERELGVERQVNSPEPHLHPDPDPDLVFLNESYYGQEGL